MNSNQSTTLTAEAAAFQLKEATQILSIGRTTLYKLIKSGDIRAVKCGRKTLILKQDMDDFVASLKEVEAGQC